MQNYEKNIQTINKNYKILLLQVEDLTELGDVFEQIMYAKNHEQ